MVYDTMVVPLVSKLLEGISATVFAYGQTGSGKTHVMGSDNLKSGIIPFTVEDLFRNKKELESRGATFSIELTYMEIYNEECFDLLSSDILSKEKEREKSSNTDVKNNSKSRGPSLPIREDAEGKTFLEGLNSLLVSDQAEVYRYVVLLL
jgi:kinesin family protein 11